MELFGAEPVKKTPCMTFHVEFGKLAGGGGWLGGSKTFLMRDEGKFKCICTGCGVKKCGCGEDKEN